MDKRTNIKVVAQLAGVSISTVSRVLNNPAAVREEMREKVLRVIEDTGYSANPIASTLKSTRRNQMAIVIPSLRQTYYTDIIKGISDCCYERQVLPLILETSGEEERERKTIENLEKQWVDGIIFIPSKNGKEGEYPEYAASLSRLTKNAESIPVVLVESYDFNMELDCVRVDYNYAFSMLAEHMLEIGRKNIVYLSSPGDAQMYEESLKGIQTAVKKYTGRDLEASYVVEAGYTVLDGYCAMRTFLESGAKVDGVVCANDQMASGALSACREKGMNVPQDIALSGFGGVALSIVTTPSITTMMAPRYELGHRAAELMFERIDGNIRETKTVVMKPYLAIRESTLRTSGKAMDVMFEE